MFHCQPNGKKADKESKFSQTCVPDGAWSKRRRTQLWLWVSVLTSMP